MADGLFNRAPSGGDAGSGDGTSSGTEGRPSHDHDSAPEGLTILTYPRRCPRPLLRAYVSNSLPGRKK